MVMNHWLYVTVVIFVVSFWVLTTTSFAQYRPSIPNAIYEGNNLVIDCVTCGPSGETTQTVSWSASGTGGNSVSQSAVTSRWISEYEMHKITITDAVGKGITTGTYVQVCASTGCSDMRRINAGSTQVNPTTGQGEYKPGIPTGPAYLTPTPFVCSLVLSSNGQEIADSSRSTSVSLTNGTIVDAALLVTVPSGQTLPNSLPIIDFGGNPDDTTNRLTMRVAGTNKFEIKGKSLDKITGYTLITVEYPFCFAKPTLYISPATPTPTVAVQATISGTTWNANNRNELTVTGSNLGNSWKLYANPGGSEDLDVEIVVSSWTSENAQVSVAQNPNKFLDTGNYLRVCKSLKTNCSGYIVISARPVASSEGTCTGPNCEFTLKVEVSTAYNTEQEARNAITSGQWNTKSVAYAVQEPRVQNPGSILFFDSRFGGRIYWDRKEGNSLCVRYISNKPDRWHMICKPLVAQGSSQAGTQNQPPSSSQSGGQLNTCPEGFVPGCEPGRCVLNIGEFSCGDKGFRCINKVPVCCTNEDPTCIR